MIKAIRSLSIATVCATVLSIEALIKSLYISAVVVYLVEHKHTLEYVLSILGQTIFGWLS